MDKKQVINIVKDYKNALAGLFPAYSVYLFGSYSKGTAKIEPVLLEQCNPSPLYEDVMKTGIAI